MQPFKPHLTHVRTPPLRRPSPWSILSDKAPFLPSFSASAQAFHTETTPLSHLAWLSAQSVLLAGLSPGMKSPLCRALHGYESSDYTQKKKKKMQMQGEKQSDQAW